MKGDSVDLINLITATAELHDVDPSLCLAIADKETGLVNSKCRYETKWGYLVSPLKYAKLLGITEYTEIQQQKFSWGAMQIMGSVARELGFKGYLNDLTFPENGIFYAVKKVKVLLSKYKVEADAISAYNQGNARKTNGVYDNAQYVVDVQAKLLKLRQLGKVSLV